MPFTARDLNVGYYLTRYDVFKSTKRSNNLLLGTARSILSLFCYLLTNKRGGNSIDTVLGGRQIMVLVGTNNHVRSIQSLSSREEVGFVTYRYSLSVTWQFVNKLYIDKIFQRFLKAGVYIFNELKSAKEEKWLIWINFNEYILSEIRRQFLLDYFTRKEGITDLFILNELKGEFRSAVFAAKDAGIRTWYVPHGITLDLNRELYPICDLYLFSGKYELQNYTSDIYDRRLFFLTREVYRGVEEQLVLRKASVGLASNSGSDYKKIKCVINHLLSLGFHVTYRPHPGHDEREEARFARECGVQYSNSNTESLDVYFRGIGVFFCGSSSMVLDSILRGKNTAIVDIDMDSMDSDLLGFIRNSIVPYLPSEFLIEQFLFYRFNFVMNDLGHYVTKGRSLNFDLINDIRHE